MESASNCLDQRRNEMRMIRIEAAGRWYGPQSSRAIIAGDDRKRRTTGAIRHFAEARLSGDSDHDCVLAKSML